MPITPHLEQPLLPSPIVFALQMTFGICWIVTYALIIYRGFVEKSCGMPFGAICGNIAWEFTYTFLFPHPMPVLIIDYIWFGLDVVILTQFIKYSRDDLPGHLAGHLFMPGLVLLLAISFSVQYTFIAEFGDTFGVYSATVLNAIMSLLFVAMLSRRDHLRGQSMYIAVAKWIGTAAGGVFAYSLFPMFTFLRALFVAIFVLDVIYIVLLYQRFQAARRAALGETQGRHRRSGLLPRSIG